MKQPNFIKRILANKKSKATHSQEKASVVRKPFVPQARFIRAKKAFLYLTPAFELGERGRRITGTPTIVKNPEEYGRVFSTGEKILYLHVELTEKNAFDRRKHAIKLIRALTKPEVVNGILKEGYVGLCGDTPTGPLIDLFVSAGGHNLGANIPSLVKFREQMRYLYNVSTKGYPRIHLGKPPTRIVFRLSEL